MLKIWRIEILKLLSGQIGVSIANAELYEQLEEKVRLRTAQLEARNRFISATFSACWYQPSLGDTIGVGVPTQVTELLGGIREAVGPIPLRCHFHNTRNTGFANAQAAVDAGVTTLDASIGGLGGCPFAPAATGNIASEDLLYMLERSHIETGVSLPAMMDTARWLQEQLGRTLPGMLMKAGSFPRPASAGQIH